MLAPVCYIIVSTCLRPHSFPLLAPMMSSEMKVAEARAASGQEDEVAAAQRLAAAQAARAAEAMFSANSEMK